MGIGEERSRVRTRLAFITSGERRILPTEMLTPPSPEWLTSTRDDEAVDDTTWSAESSWFSGWLPERWRGARLGAGRSGAIVLVLVGIVVVGVTVVAVGRDQPVAHAVPSLPAVDEGAPAPAVGEAAGPVPAPPPPAPAPADEEMVVSVVGLVVSAGLVTLPPGSRVADALRAAGGVRDGADTLNLNLAQRLSDGDQVLVGAAAPDAPASTVGGASTGTGSPFNGKDTVGGRVNLNTATETELDALPGVGPVTAAAIVAWRKTNGRFTAIDQLGEVDGIGPVRLEKLRDSVTL